MSDGARLFRPEFRRLLMVMLGQGSLVALPLTATPVLTIWLMGGDGVFLQSLISLGVYLAWAVPMLAAATLAIHIGFPTLLGRHAMCLYTATGKPHWFAYRDIQRVDLNHSWFYGGRIMTITLSNNRLRIMYPPLDKIGFAQALSDRITVPLPELIRQDASLGNP